MDVGLLKFIFSDISLVALLMSPGMVVSLIFFFVGYKIIKSSAKRYLDIQERQLKVMEEFIFAFAEMKSNLTNTKIQSDALELTLKRMSEDISVIKLKLEELKGKQG